ncbi:hypothetical protein GCM10022393_32600 [Aquimarina addita]|uniref:Deoxyribose-phosphate aldolase n=2 Tax=Aquimarina addita TaxID=870485 RepID=A0ABP6UQJ7_9FLAO
MISFGQFSAQDIIQKTIENAGGSKFEDAIIDFTFRGKQYRSERSNGLYRLERRIEKGDDLLHDVLTNNGLSRTVNNCHQQVPDSLVARISDGINSVHYFANLPYGLNAAAVRKKMVGEVTIRGNLYYKMHITFDEEGGGTDFEDEFMYWIHKENYTVDYFAYKYAVNGGGIRFREAYNPRIIEGIRFVDYKNYKTDDISTSLATLDTLFEKNRLQLLSVIALENIYVYMLENQL